MAKHIDGFRYLGSESIHGDDCDKIEVSILDRQRSQYYWIADLDFLPRRVLEIVRLQNEVVTREEWSQVRLNEEIADKMFSWTPPAGWQQWVLPKKNLNWPPIGSQAPEFALRSIDGKRVRLSEFRGNVVWLNFWRLGCPPCIEELPHLQSFHEELRDSGLTLIGINVTDEKRRVQKLLGSKGITYLNVIDQSPEAERVYLDVYGVGAIPMNYIVDRSGTIIDAWVGYSTDRTVNAIRKAGLSANEHPALAIDHGKRGEQPDEPDSASRGD
ncbi:MAG: redoxin domain-containing protein [Planctomycetales bacterium]|nr:redoxin domain-containing protein [Planctomycetales bacterium]